MVDRKPRDESFEALEEVIQEAEFRDRIIVTTPALKKIVELAVEKRAPKKQLEVILENRRDEDDLVHA